MAVRSFNSFIRYFIGCTAPQRAEEAAIAVPANAAAKKAGKKASALVASDGEDDGPVVEEMVCG